jgi:hypothetical protein
VDRGRGHAHFSNTDRGTGRYDLTGRLDMAGSGGEGVSQLQSRLSAIAAARDQHNFCSI